MSKTYTIKTCVLCKEEFVPSGSKQRYCKKNDTLHLNEKQLNKRKTRTKSYTKTGKLTARYKTIRRKLWLDKYKLAKGCCKCGYNIDSRALDFDHIEPYSKKFTISRNIGSNIKSIFDEIRKCRLLCANCHRIVTFEQNLYYKKRFNNNDTK